MAATTFAPTYSNPRWKVRGHRWGRTWRYYWTCDRCGHDVYGPILHTEAHRQGFWEPTE